jgi:hypothetical protein
MDVRAKQRPCFNGSSLTQSCVVAVSPHVISIVGRLRLKPQIEMIDVKDKQRFSDSGQTVYGFQREILVACPKCQSCARVSTIELEDVDLFSPRRLSCFHCGYSRKWNQKLINFQWYAKPTVDGFFGEPLWLQVSCGNEVLWAFNLEHLELIENYVSAKLRERRKSEDYGWQNKSLVSRLPKWISAAKNRDVVLKAIQKLKDKGLDCAK